MLGDGHVRFGGRVGETEHQKRCHRAPVRPDSSTRGPPRAGRGQIQADDIGDFSANAGSLESLKVPNRCGFDFLPPERAM